MCPMLQMNFGHKNSPKAQYEQVGLFGWLKWSPSPVLQATANAFEFFNKEGYFLKDCLFFGEVFRI